MSDLISRQALCEFCLNTKDKTVDANDIMRFPSVCSKLENENPPLKWEEFLEMDMKPVWVEFVKDPIGLKQWYLLWIDHEDNTEVRAVDCGGFLKIFTKRKFDDGYFRFYRKENE